jgi:protein-S-isoprenylcysteine O-methyltransferase Ste14
MFTLGIKNTSGLKDGFVNTGPYRYTRNPQYVGDTILFTGMILVSNSFYVAITHLLTILVFLLTPLTEERWLENQYGEDYLEYKRTAPRFL